MVSNYQQFARFASVIIYKIYGFREAERRAGEKRKIHKIYKISLACEQEHYFLNAKKVQFLKKNFVSFRIVCIFALSNVEVREGAVSAY